MKSSSKPAKAPGSAPGSAQKDPHNQKENCNACNASPSEKRRKVVCKDVFGARQLGSETKALARQVFCALQEASPISAQKTVTDQAVSEGVLMRQIECENMVLTKEEVEALLNMKMAGKTKYDFKGKSEQMMEYIKKLRQCIRQFQELECRIMEERDELENELEIERRDRAQSEALMKSKQDELELGLSQVKAMCAILEESLLMSKCEKEALLAAREKDAEALQSSAKEQSLLLEELERVRCESVSLGQQVCSLQDLNKRLQEYNTSLQQYNSKLQNDASVTAEAMSKLQKEKSTIMENLSTLRGHSATLQEQLDISKLTLQEELRQKKTLIEEAERLHGQIQRCTDERDQHAAQVLSLTEENSRYKECTGKSAAELEFLSSKAIALEQCYTSQSENVKALKQELDIATHKIKIMETTMLMERSEGVEQKLKIEELTKRLAEADIRIREGDLIRKKLHNTIQELKGNIRVFCRVRPLLPEDEESESDSKVIQYPTSTELLGRGLEVLPAQGQKHLFSFDKVFGPEAGQESIFTEISQLVQSALDGYKVCIFAYGQTGSGKTHTMLGDPDIREERGVIPRSLEQIFKSSQEFTSRGWNFRMQASMLEIYNEQIRDLLASGRNSNSESGTPVKQHQVKHDQNGNTSVTDLTLVDVSNWDEVSSLLQRATQSRSVGKTAINEQSSRSHCVFTLRISGVNEGTEQEVHGILNLIDLAGSERLSRSGSTGDRLKETQAINKSLASLGDVIAAIANKEQYIPYRNSKLTYLLQPCLGGDSKTLMFVTISPDSKSSHESLCSLRFAAKVNTCEIGVPRRQTLARPYDSRLS